MSYKPLSKLFYGANQEYINTYNQRFSSENCTKLDFDIAGNPAFFLRTPELYEKVVNIYKIDKIVLYLKNMIPGVAIEQFKNSSLIDEVLLTNKIEGVYSTRREISKILETLDSNDKNKRFKGLIQKYKMLGKDKINLNTCEDIRAIYDELVLNEVKEADKDNVPDGDTFRAGTVSVYSLTDKEIHRGVFPESKIKEYMDKSLQMLKDDKINIMFRIAIFHYLFGYIHPFYDGNGRVSRFISSYLLTEELTPIIGYRLSYTIKENIKEYHDSFKICNTQINKGDITPFVYYFLDVIEKAIDDLEFSLYEKYEQYNNYLNKMINFPNGDNEKYKELYNYLIQAALFSEHGISTKELVSNLEISQSTLAKRLTEIPAELIKCNKVGKEKFYLFNTDKLDEPIN
jgi:Fic family protein